MHFTLISGFFYPANAAIFSTYLVSIVSFSLIPDDLLSDLLYSDLDEQKPFNENFK